MKLEIKAGDDRQTIGIDFLDLAALSPLLTVLLRYLPEIIDLVRKILGEFQRDNPPSPNGGVITPQ